MKCPIDNVDLVMSERHGIEIDYCPTCRGVWLDRGELDKIIERAAPQAQPQPQSFAPPPRRDDEYRSRDNDQRSRSDDYHRSRDDDYRDRDGRPRKRREGFLGELFDF
jgi:uncharacterized protein